jgi:imidazolonepropionase-like amidohydrolase
MGPRSPLRLAVCVLSWLALTTAAVTSAPDVLVLEDVTVIDGTGALPQPHRDVVVEGGRIRAITPHGAQPRLDGARRLPLSGRFVIPGLVDLHAHVTFLRDPASLTGYDRKTSEEILKILLAWGVTTVRNPQAPAKEGVALREDVRAGLVPGPRLFTAGDSLNWRDATNAKVTAEVRRQARAGVDFVKLYSSMPEPLVAAAIAEAHRDGVKVIGHLQKTTWSDALRLGIDALTHGASWSPEMLPPARRAQYAERMKTVGPLRARLDWLEWIDLRGPEVANVIADLARTRVPVDPTLVAYDTKFRPARYRTSADLAYTPAPVLHTWRDGGATGDWTADELARAASLWPKALGLVKGYHDGGVLLAAGSDLPNAWVVPGLGLHRELELLGDAGLTPLEVLRAATHNGAAALGVLNDTGTLEAGKAADIVVLSADPTKALANTRRIEMVLQDGRVLDRGALFAAAGVTHP